MTNNITNTVPALVASIAGPLTPDQGLTILNSLIGRADIPAADLAQTYQNLVAVHTNAFAPVAPVAEVKKKRRRRTNLTLSPNLGWPKGVSREEYKAFKEAPPADFTEGMNPQAYKRYQDAKAGIVPVVADTTPAPAPTPEPEATKAAAVVNGTKKQAKDAGIDAASNAPVTSGKKVEKAPSPAALAAENVNAPVTSGRKAAGKK